jgi:hypothetical protein
VGHEDGLGLDGDVVLDGEVVDLFWAGSVGFGRARERERKRGGGVRKGKVRRSSFSVGGSSFSLDHARVALDLLPSQPLRSRSRILSCSNMTPTVIVGASEEKATRVGRENRDENCESESALMEGEREEINRRRRSTA